MCHVCPIDFVCKERKIIIIIIIIILTKTIVYTIVMVKPNYLITNYRLNVIELQITL